MNTSRHVAGFADERKRAFEWQLSNANAKEVDSWKHRWEESDVDHCP
jgi:hypothetical protein